MAARTPQGSIVPSVLVGVGLPWFFGALWLVTTGSVLLRGGWIRPCAVVGLLLPWAVLLAVLVWENLDVGAARRVTRMALACAALVGACAAGHVVAFRPGVFGAAARLDVSTFVRAILSLDTPAVVLVAQALPLSVAAWLLQRSIRPGEAGRPPRVAGDRVHLPAWPARS